MVPAVTMNDATAPVQIAYAMPVNTEQTLPALRRRGHPVFAGTPLPVAAAGNIYGLPTKSPTIRPALSMPRTTSAETSSTAHHATALLIDADAPADARAVSDGNLVPTMILLLTTSQPGSPYPCVY